MNGILFPSYLAAAQFEANAGFAAAYPFTNAQDIVRPSRLARADGAAGVRYAKINLPAGASVRAIALIGHNAPPGSNVGLTLYAGLDHTGAILHDATHEIWPAGSTPTAGRRAIRPILLNAAVAARSALVHFNPMGAAWEVQAIDIGGFWEWPMGYGRELGVKADATETPLAGGASYRPERNLKPRTVTGQVDLMKMAETATAGLDFQKGLDIQRPFVWAEDWEDPASWARKCLLVRNEEVSPMVGALYRRDRFPINLIEHQK